MSTDLKLAPLPSRGVISITGPEAREFLQGLITNDMEKLSETQALYAALLTPQGKILFDFFLTETGGVVLLDCHKDHLPALLKRLKMYRLRAAVELEDVSEGWSIAALFGGAGETTKVEGGVVFVDPRHKALGSRVLMRPDTLIEEAARATEADYEAWRLALGVANVPADAEQDKTFLLEANFDELNGVDFDKGCYIGQELASRMKRRNGLRKRLLPVTVEGTLPLPGTPIMAGDRTIGTVRTGIGNRAIALIRIDRLAEASGETLNADGITLIVDWPNWIPK